MAVNGVGNSRKIKNVDEDQECMMILCWPTTDITIIENTLISCIDFHVFQSNKCQIGKGK